MDRERGNDSLHDRIADASYRCTVADAASESSTNTSRPREECRFVCHGERVGTFELHAIAPAEVVRSRSIGWDHPFATMIDEPHRSPPAWLARLRTTASVDDPLRVASIMAVQRTLDNAAVPHVLPIRAVERGADGLLAVYRRVAGVDLGRLVRRGPLPLPRVFAILRQICRCLAEAHAVGIGHGLLGPASVVVEAEGGSDQVWIADFGLASLFEHDEDTRCLALHPTTPERVFGGGTETSEDVYLVGVLAFWMLTGEPPFGAENLETLRRRHAIEDPKGVSEVAGRAIPDRLEAAVADALRKDPDERPQDIVELEARILAAQMQSGIETPWDAVPTRRHFTGPVRTVPVVPRVTRLGTAVVGAGVRPIHADVAVQPTAAAAANAAPPLRGDVAVAAGPSRDRMRGHIVALVAGATASWCLAIALALSDEPEPELRSAGLLVDRDPAPASTPTAAPRASTAVPRATALALPPPPGPVPAIARPVEVAPAASVAPSVAKPHAVAVSPTTKPPADRDHATAECDLVRRAAVDARNAHDWAGLLRHSTRASCWSARAEPTKLRVKALLELGRFAECVDVGRDVRRDAELDRWLALCATRTEPTL